MPDTYLITLQYSNGVLIVDPPSQDVYRGDTIIWILQTGINVQNFKVRGTNSVHFFNSLSTSYGTSVRVVVKSTAPLDTPWKYSVDYHVNNITLHIDPKITVKPNPNPTSVFTLISIIIIIVMSVFGIRKWRKKQKLVKP